MKKLKLLILSFIFLLMPALSLGVTGHINGCTNTTFDTNCCTKTFKITALPGYTIVDVIVNGVSQGAITSYTFSNISGPQTLKVITTSNGGSTGGGTTGGDTGGGTTTSGYKVKFNANGGTGSMPSQTFEDGTTAALNACTYTKTGFAFQGWALSADGAVVYADQTVISVTEEMTLYAIWKCTQCNGATTVPTTCTTCNGAKKVTCTTCNVDGNGVCYRCDGNGNCYKCNGRGRYDCPECDNDPDGCSRCDYEGRVDCTYCNVDGDGVCASCDGSGKCYTCSGTGKRNCSTCSGVGTVNIDCPTC